VSSARGRAGYLVLIGISLGSALAVLVHPLEAGALAIAAAVSTGCTADCAYLTHGRSEHGDRVPIAQL
jgi:hypothetical protein